VKREEPRPSPLKPYLGLHHGKVEVFVSPWPLSLLSPRHLRETPPPEPTADAEESLKRLEKYFSQ
jgi:hypothetical protein